MGLCIESAKQHNNLARERDEKSGGMKKNTSAMLFVILLFVLLITPEIPQ